MDNNNVLKQWEWHLDSRELVYSSDFATNCVTVGEKFHLPSSSFLQWRNERIGQCDPSLACGCRRASFLDDPVSANPSWQWSWVNIFPLAWMPSSSPYSAFTTWESKHSTKETLLHGMTTAGPVSSVRARRESVSCKSPQTLSDRPLSNAPPGMGCFLPQVGYKAFSFFWDGWYTSTPIHPALFHKIL